MLLVKTLYFVFGLQKLCPYESLDLGITPHLPEIM